MRCRPASAALDNMRSRAQDCNIMPRSITRRISTQVPNLTALIVSAAASAIIDRPTSAGLGSSPAQRADGVSPST